MGQQTNLFTNNHRIQSYFFFSFFIQKKSEGVVFLDVATNIVSNLCRINIKQPCPQLRELSHVDSIDTKRSSELIAGFYHLYL